MLEILSEQNSVRDAAAWLASCSRLLIAWSPPGALQWRGEAFRATFSAPLHPVLCSPSPDPFLGWAALQSEGCGRYFLISECQHSSEQQWRRRVLA